MNRWGVGVSIKHPAVLVGLLLEEMKEEFIALFLNFNVLNWVLWLTSDIIVKIMAATIIFLICCLLSENINNLPFLRHFGMSQYQKQQLTSLKISNLEKDSRWGDQTGCKHDPLRGYSPLILFFTVGRRVWWTYCTLAFAAIWPVTFKLCFSFSFYGRLSLGTSSPCHEVH